MHHGLSRKLSKIQNIGAHEAPFSSVQFTLTIKQWTL